MSDASSQEHDALLKDIESARQRLAALTTPPAAPEDREGDGPEDPGSAAALAEVASGLDALLMHLRDNPPDEEEARTRLEVLARGLGAVADYLAPPEPPSPHEAPDPSAPDAGLGQFIQAFRNEAQKRLSGLSLSMMGLFNQQTSDPSLDKSAQHLHAIRGGAAMLGLKTIAEVSGLMEQVLVTMRKLEPAERDWPTRALMGGYRLLEAAAADPDAHVDPDEAAHVINALRECFDDLLADTTLEELSRPRVEDSEGVEDDHDDDHDDDGAPDQPQPEAPSRGGSAGDIDDFAALANDPSGAGRAEAQPELLALSQTTSLRGMEQRILIVDDIETIAASVGFVLSELDLPIDIASHGEEALGMMGERPYSLIISDIDMPRMDGVALTRMVRRDESLRDIPIILLTGLDHPSERDAGFDAGANDYIIKGSIGGGELVHRVRELLKIAPFVPAEAQHIPRQRRRILVAEDAETVAASIAFILSEGDFEIVLTSNGHEALTKLERQDFDLLISDWQMPAMSGDELTRAVRASGHIRQLPIVLLTSLDSDKVRLEAREAGADRFLVKGEIAGGALLEIVEELLGSS